MPIRWLNPAVSDSPKQSEKPLRVSKTVKPKRVVPPMSQSNGKSRRLAGSRRADAGHQGRG